MACVAREGRNRCSGEDIFSKIYTYYHKVA